MKNKNIPTFFIIILVIILFFAAYGINSFNTHTLNIGNTSNKIKNETIIKNFILKNPEIIIESLKKFESNNTNLHIQNFQNEILSKRELIEKVDKSPIFNTNNTDITIVQFYDYRCGYCKKFSSTLKHLLIQDPNIKIIFKELPILGEKSHFLARLALAVHVLYPAKFWDFHNKLMETRDLSSDSLQLISQELQLDYHKIINYSENPVVQKIIKDNQALAREINISSTPTVIINGNLILHPYDIKQLQDYITSIRVKTN